LKIEDKLRLNRFITDEVSHLSIISEEKCLKCKDKPCTYTCCVETYKWEGNKITIRYEGCLECGTCRIVCPYQNISWRYPKGGYGIQYKYG
jgi:ferredoxin like protein